MSYAGWKRKLGHSLVCATACIAAVLVVGPWVWYYTAIPAVAARFVWQQYRFAPLAIALNRSDAELAMLIGNYHFNGTIGGGSYDPEVARKAFAKAVSINPDILWGHYQLARIYFVKGDVAAALREIEQELAANPENLRSLYVRGLIYGYRAEPGDLARAEEDFRRFVEWAPMEWAGYNDLAWILSTEGKNREAEKMLDIAFENVPQAADNPWLWNSLGVAQLNQGEYRNAAYAFERAERLADSISVSAWREAYPGNNPKHGESGLTAFRQAVADNRARAQAVCITCAN